jgi:hypothetical protein
MANASRIRGQVERLRRIVYSIGIYAGSSPFTLADPPGIRNPVLTWRSVTDEHAYFVADPFLVRGAGGWHMFFEMMIRRDRSWRGVIAHAESPDGLEWRYRRMVLEEPFHLSYPQVFEWRSDFYMIPESREAGAVRLYRADPFPHRWIFVTEILKGPVLLDSTVFQRDARWWMFAATGPGNGSETVRLFHAPEPAGPWKEHPGSPIVSGNPRSARPAGRVISFGDRLIRLAQVCVPTYGRSVNAFEILRLDRSGYEERECPGNPILQGGSDDWNRTGMHHMDVHRLDDERYIASVDGWRFGLARPREVLQRMLGG